MSSAGFNANAQGLHASNIQVSRAPNAIASRPCPCAFPITRTSYYHDSGNPKCDKSGSRETLNLVMRRSLRSCILWRSESDERPRAVRRESGGKSRWRAPPQTSGRHRFEGNRKTKKEILKCHTSKL